MNNIRICHFTTVHPRTDVRVFHKQCVSLANAGFEVYYVVADGKGDDIVKGVKIHDIGKMPNRLTRIILSPILMLSVLFKLKCKIYQFHDPELLPVAFLLKIFTKARVIYDSHECYADFFLQKDYIPKYIRPLCSLAVKTLENFVGKRLDWIIVTTNHHANSLKGINRHIDIIHNYPLLSEGALYSQKDNIEKSRNLCYIGSITEERGLTQLIKAIESIDCKLLLAGSYEPPNYREELTKLPGWSKITEYGYVNREQAAEITEHSVFGVVLFLPQPIHYTSLSTKVFEYMAGGIACLVPDFPIWKEVVLKYDCGICVNPMDIKEIAEQIKYLLDNPVVAHRMGKNGKKIIQEKYNWESQKPILLNIYKNLLSI